MLTILIQYVSSYKKKKKKFTIVVLYSNICLQVAESLAVFDVDGNGLIPVRNMEHHTVIYTEHGTPHMYTRNMEHHTDIHTEHGTPHSYSLGWVNFSEFEITVCGSCKM